MNRHSVIFAAAIAFALWAGFAAAQEPPAPEKKPRTLREFIDASLDAFKLFSDADSEEPAEILTALRWANNARGSEDGVTLLYVHRGRPLAAACVYPWESRLEHDFESLSRGKIVARLDGKTVWQPQTPGVTFADIPGAPPVEATRPMRLRQMKALAEQFQATLLGWKVDNTDREELRLLSRPLYRYDPKGGEVTDGAVFAFVMGTDPEALLLIEAVSSTTGQGGGDSARWQYGFARRTSGELEGRFQETVVWNAPRFPPQADPTLPHFTRGTPVPPALVAPRAIQETAR